MQSCTGFVITNEYFPIGCCYLKTRLNDVNRLDVFVNGIVGQTYKKTFIGLGNEPTKAGYQLMGIKDSPDNDIPGACWITLDACFQLCDSKGNVRMPFDNL